MSSINNKNISSSASSDLYERNALYAPEDILNVSKAEDSEQQRRIADVEGENHKRVLANNLAVFFGENVRATWFQRGSSFVLSLLGNVRSAVANKASDITASVSNKAGDLGHKAALNIAHTADGVGHKAQEALFNASNTLANKAGEVGVQTAEKAHQLSDVLANKAEQTAVDIKEKSLETAHNVSSLAQEKASDLKAKGLETAHDISSSVSSQAQTAALNIKEKSLETAHSVSSLAQEKASDLKTKGLETAQGAKSFLSDKVNEYTSWLKGAVLNMSLYKKFGQFTGHTNMTFAMLEEEAERAYRMNSSSEIHAIENAQKVAALIKGLHGRSSDPHIHFSTRILEEAERSRRVFEVQTDKAAIDNGKAVSLLINQKFNISESSVEQLTFKKPEVNKDLLEEIRSKPFAAAM